MPCRCLTNQCWCWHPTWVLPQSCVPAEMRLCSRFLACTPWGAPLMLHGYLGICYHPKCRPASLSQLSGKPTAFHESAVPLQVGLLSSSRRPCQARKALLSAAVAGQAVRAPVQGRSWGGPALVNGAQVRQNAHHHQAWCRAAGISCLYRCFSSASCAGIWCHPDHAHRRWHLLLLAGLLRLAMQQLAASGSCSVGSWMVWPAGGLELCRQRFC